MATESGLSYEGMTEISTPDALAQLAGPHAGEAWAVLAERFGVGVWRLIASRLRDNNEAEDAYQEFWMALPQNAARFRPLNPDPERSARAWIMRIAYVTAVSHLNRREAPNGVIVHSLHHQSGCAVDQDQGSLLQSPDKMAVDDPSPAADEDAEGRARLIGKVHEAIGILPEGYRRPLLLHVVGGLSYEELAMDLRCTVNNARVRVHRGLKRLREILGADGNNEEPDRALAGLIVPLVAFLPPVPSISSATAKKAAGLQALPGGKSAGVYASLTKKTALVVASLIISSAAVVTSWRLTHSDPPVPDPAITAPAITRVFALLDEMPASSGAYGFRRLRSAYTGPAIRVRSGDRQQDIGFATGGDLDLTALRSFCAKGDGYLVCWYDQSGNAADLVQQDIARQPRVVERGEVLTINGRSAVYIAGAEEWLDAIETMTVGSVTALLRSSHAQIFPDWKVVVASSSVFDRRYFRGKIDYTTFDTAGDMKRVFHVNGQRSNDGDPLDRGKVVTMELQKPIANESLRLGNDCYQTNLRGWNGYISEVIIFPTTLPSGSFQALAVAERDWLNGDTGEAKP